MTVFFDGRQLVTPTVASKVDDSKLYPRSLAGANTLAIIGRSTAGKPKTAIVVNDPLYAKQLLQGGELLDAARRALAPSSAVGGPARVVVLRINPATQAALTLQDAGANDVIALKSTDYGLHANGVSLKIEDGTLKGKRVTVRYRERLAYYSGDDIARDAFTVQYTGGEATGQVQVSNAQMVLEAPAASAVATIDLNEFKTVQELADRINAVPDWTATVSPGSANTPAVNGLDAVTDADAKTAELTVTANLQAVIDWINSGAEGYLDATREAGAGAPPANIDWSYLSGAGDGTVTNTDWQDCFNALQGEDVQWIAPLSADSGIWAMADAHCIYMSSIGKMERRAFVGMATGQTLQQAIDAAATLNSDRTSLVYPGLVDFDENDVLQTLPGYQAAAQIGGAFAAMDPGETMTNKPLSVAGLEVELNNPAETDALINRGVLCLARSPRGGVRVVKAITTWLNDRRFNRVEISTGRALDFVTRSVREALEDFVGRRGNVTTLLAARETVDSTLRILSSEAPIGPGVLAGDAQHPPYRNIVCTIDGDVLTATFECSPVIPINYVLVTVHASIYRARA